MQRQLYWDASKLAYTKPKNTRRNSFNDVFPDSHILHGEGKTRLGAWMNLRANSRRFKTQQRSEGKKTSIEWGIPQFMKLARI